MTVPDIHVINAVLTQWRASSSGSKLRHVQFPDAQTGECHANAAAYAAQHGTEVVHGFLLHQRTPWLVHVMAHSVVRLSYDDLVDPTLTDQVRTGHAYFEHIGSAEMFLRNANAWGEVPVAIGDVPDAFGQHASIAPNVDNPTPVGRQSGTDWPP